MERACSIITDVLQLLKFQEVPVSAADTYTQTDRFLAAPSEPQQERSGGGSSSAVTGTAPHGKAARHLNIE